MVKFAFLACALQVAVTALGVPMKAEVAASDKKNWGDAVYTASADPEGKVTVLSDLVVIKNALGHEQLYLKAFMGKFEKSLDSSGPEDMLAEALRKLSAPLDPVPQRDFSNVHATKGELTGIKSLANTKNAMGHFERMVRAKARVAIKADIESQVFSRYNTFNKATEMMPQCDKLVNAFEEIDRRWGRFLKQLDRISNGTDKWKYSAEQLADTAEFYKFFDKVLMESELADFYDVSGRMLPKLDRNVRAIDRILKRIDKEKLEEFDKAIGKSSDANAAAFTEGGKEWSEWYADHGLAIDPYPREFIRGLSEDYRKFGHEHYVLLSKCENVLKTVKDESNSLGKLRMCSFRAPNGAFTVRSGTSDRGTPAYTRKCGELGLEAMSRFKKATAEIFKRQGKPVIMY